MGNNGTLLCIDDDIRCIAIRKLLLERYGYKVLTTTDPREALRVFASETVEGVILDHQMAHMDGARVAAVMREIKPEVPILLLSALPSMPDNAVGLVDAFVTKAAPTEHLVSEIEQMLAA